MSSQYTKKDILRMVQEQDAEFIRLQFTDIFGRLKNVAIMASQTEKALKNQVMIDGSSVEGFTRIHESDQYLVPDRDTFAILPWRPRDGSVARLICEVYKEQTGKDMIVEAIHAGLECGYFSGKMPGLDCVSIGPDVNDVHTPNETLSISSTQRTWELVKEVVARMK